MLMLACNVGRRSGPLAAGQGSPPRPWRWNPVARSASPGSPVRPLPIGTSQAQGVMNKKPSNFNLTCQAFVKLRLENTAKEPWGSLGLPGASILGGLGLRLPKSRPAADSHTHWAHRMVVA